MTTEKRRPRQVETGGGAFVGGNVDTGSGDFIGRDSVKSVVRGSVGNLFTGTNDGGSVDQEDAPLAAFRQALDEFAEKLQDAELSPGLKKAVAEDVDTVAAEIQSAEPDDNLIIHKVDSINQLLAKMAATAVSLTGLSEMADRVLRFATDLFK